MPREKPKIVIPKNFKEARLAALLNVDDSLFLRFWNSMEPNSKIQKTAREIGLILSSSKPYGFMDYSFEGRNGGGVGLAYPTFFPVSAESLEELDTIQFHDAHGWIRGVNQEHLDSFHLPYDIKLIKAEGVLIGTA